MDPVTLIIQQKMKTKYLSGKRVIIFLLLLSACSTPFSSKEEHDALISRARSKVLSSNIGLSAQDREIISTKEPKWGFYILAGDYADYDFAWKTTDATIVLRGRGSLVTLEDGKVTKVKTDSPANGP